MSDNKKYYYFKMTDNFFDSDAMVILESMPDGYLYSNILLKLYTKSLKDDGRLMFNERIPYNPTVLAQLTRHSVGVVEKALEVLKQLGLIEVLDNGAIYMMDIQRMIGSSNTEADRKRAYRQRIAEEQKMGHLSIDCPDIHPPEIEIKKEKEIKNDFDAFFESIWKLYPEKKGKGAVSLSQKKRLYKLGYDTIAKCIQRYKADKPENISWKHGSTFFNTGYIDYLDENYQQIVENERKILE